MKPLPEPLPLPYHLYELLWANNVALHSLADEHMDVLEGLLEPCLSYLIVVKGAVPSKAVRLKYLLKPWEAWVVREAGVKYLHGRPQPPAALNYREVPISWRN